MKWSALIFVGASALVGCGGEYDGTWVGGTGLITAGVMKLSGDNASIDLVNTAQRTIIKTYEFGAEVKKEKLHLTNQKGQVFVYALAADDVTLECVSSSCQGWGRLGNNGMPREWTAHKE